MSKKVKKKLSSVKECIKERLAVDNNKTFVIFKDRHVLFDPVTFKPLPGVEELLSFLVKENIDFALVSQDTYSFVSNNLRHTGLDSFFPEEIVFTKNRSEHEEEIFGNISNFAKKRMIKQERLNHSYTSEIVNAVMHSQHSLDESILIDNCCEGVISAIFSNIEVAVVKVNYSAKDLAKIPPGYDYYTVNNVA
tara:strand:+ start:1600 stop:2178 length:579 start_codon:yes stop_codon:yes gene_type:complete